MSLAEPVIAHAESTFPQALDRLKALLRIPSISADPARAGDVLRAAEWLRDELAGLGFTVEVRETQGLPMVLARHPGPAEGEVPHLLYYGHYDVQPAEPLELWNSPPFEPAIVQAEHGPRLVARGAEDDKGQLMTFVEAFRAWIAVHGTLPVKVTVLLEGEEESGSPSLVPFLEANREELGADVCIITDTTAIDVDTPAITTRLRGLVYEEVTLWGPSHDLHSGLFGGAALNPLVALSRIIAQLHDENGRVRLDGFYDGVQLPSIDELAGWRALPVREEDVLADIGLTRPAGESGWSFLERLWARPALDVNGIRGGHIDEGAKTVIPAKAVAKVSCRLVPGQDPEAVAASIRRFFTERAPDDARLEFRSFGAAPAYVLEPDNRFLRATMAGLNTVFSRPAVLRGYGGSIPVTHHIKTILGYDSILVGFGLDDDRIHSPNEKFEVKCYRGGIRGHIAMLARFAGMTDKR
jgi:acetylornithine deacetylase/succinyl-diaminopimelate desuccinylase-like protein